MHIVHTSFVYFKTSNKIKGSIGKKDAVILHYCLSFFFIETEMEVTFGLTKYGKRMAIDGANYGYYFKRQHVGGSSLWWCIKQNEKCKAR